MDCIQWSLWYLFELIEKNYKQLPLSYIIRDIEIPIHGVVYLTKYETLVQNAVVMEPGFDKDNARVYGILKWLILEGAVWSFITPWIDQAAHGQIAWLALRAHYEGESFMTKQKEEAYTALNAVHIADFIVIHLHAIVQCWQSNDVITIFFWSGDDHQRTHWVIFHFP